MVNLVIAEALDARVTLADEMIMIGLERGDAPVDDCGSEAACRLANTAKS
jgi:hypothetical protein